ncbi:ABC transporter ATP-binding protein [Micromonospora sp. ALFpr18c]|uniref:ATP-binding cassette domain-containing protein n=1 Tax=unclassified Micromonospora TaxID=2617518 RepID=UPI00124AF4CF|nr:MULTISPECIES: ABC transporter ATP-binding protein [unclassified Micromonospora]KAB1947086.1 ABC transporter ATP-binding protein [Micromonospora sp. ALFpr18c]MDG4761734.1 ABC transporter ATP-binding protein [Micromonospora sp. WMMD710]
MSLLAVDRLAICTADGTPLVSDISFELPSGGRLGVIGESGSGKSLTTLALLGLLPAGLRVSGSIRFHPAGGEPVQVVGASESALRRLRGRVATVVFQEPSTALDPLMRLGDQIGASVRRTRGLRGPALRAAVLSALADVGLDHRIGRAYPHEVSGGQRQRAAIAAAVACRPALLVADEPTTALDVTVQADVLALLDRLVADRGLALLFISHDLAVVSRIAERVLVLDRGSAIESGTVTEILTAPRHPVTRALLESARHLDAALEVRQP